MKKQLLTAAVVAGLSTQASAFIVDTGDSDWSVRWDNTFKWNIMQRVATRDSDICNPAGNLAGGILCDGDASFDRGDIVSNRLDILSELDVIWNDTAGFRISAAGWYDHAYRNGTNAKSYDDKFGATNPNNWLTAVSADFAELTDEEERLHHRGGEILDAFVFWNWEAGDVVGNLRAGRHVIYWGQSLLATGAINSVGGAMNPIDFAKGLSVPGSEAKELFMPTNKISTLIQLTDSLTLSAYYSLQWDHYRLPVGTTYFSPSGLFGEEVDGLWLLAGGAAMKMEPDEEAEGGEWGINLAYYVEDLGMEISAYYLNVHEKIQNGFSGCLYLPDNNPITGSEAGDPACMAAPGVIKETGAGFAHFGRVKWTFKEDTDLYGLSISKQIGDVSYGLDITHRRDTAIRPSLNSALFRTAVDLNGFDYDQYAALDENNYDMPTGNTWGVVINALGLLNDNGLWEGGSYIVELTFNMVDEFTNNPAQFPIGGTGFNTGLSAISSVDANDDRVNSDTNVEEGRIMSHIGFVFKPTWYQVWPGTDMTAIIAGGVGIDGNGYGSFTGDEESGSVSAGLEFNVNQTWSATIRYNNYFGPQPNSFDNNLKDRDNVSLTFKRTF